MRSLVLRRTGQRLGISPIAGPRRLCNDSHNVRTVLITAGASAPEDLVQAIIDELKEHYGATVEERQIIAEGVSFEAPSSLKRLEERITQISVQGNVVGSI